MFILLLYAGPTPKAFAGVHFKQPDGELTVSAADLIRHLRRKCSRLSDITQLKIVQPKFRPVSEKSTLFKTAKDGMLQIRIAATVPGQTSTTGEPRRDYSNAATFTLFAADLPALVQAPMSQTVRGCTGTFQQCLPRPSSPCAYLPTHLQLHMSQAKTVDGAPSGEAKLEIVPLPSPTPAGAAAGTPPRPGPAAQYRITVSEGIKSAS